MAQFPAQTLVGRLRHLVGAPVGSETDARLLARFNSDGDEAAFSALLERHGPMVLGVCRRFLTNPHDVDDAFQAVFIVLSRKAGSIQWSESIGGWLHAVATRIALKSRSSAAQRQAREKEITDMHAQPSHQESAPTDLRAVLDEELQRLPARLRDPLVLCYLNGQSNEEAARQLNRPVGTVWYQLSKARELLRSRLARRGLALSAAVLAQTLEASSLSAAVPAHLMQTALRAGLAAPLGNTALTPLVSTRTLSLAEGALQAMFVQKMKIAAALVAAAVIVGVGIGVGVQTDKAQAVVPIVDNKKVNSTSEPAGAVLEARLIAKTSDVTLDPQMLKRLEAFQRRQILINQNQPNGAANAAVFVGGPTPQAVDLVLELRNTSNKPVKLLSYQAPFQDGYQLKIDMKGVGVQDVEFHDLRPLGAIQGGRVLPLQPAQPVPVRPIRVRPVNPAPAPLPPNQPPRKNAPAQPKQQDDQAVQPVPAPQPAAPPAQPRPNRVRRQIQIAQPARAVPIGAPVRVAVGAPAQPPKVIEIAPGKTFEIPIKYLRFASDNKNKAHHLYWTKPGEFKLSVKVTVAMDPAPKDAKQEARFGAPEGFGQVVLTSNPVTIKVSNKK